jgi:protein-S-isoprenylcysteine O-methyltransferase Ste14
MRVNEAPGSEDASMTADLTVPVAPSRWMPPRLFVLYGLAGAALHFLLPAPILLRLVWLGAAVALAGVALAVWGERTFARAGATIKPFERSRVLVTSGPFRFTRNPMYLGLVSMLVGLALALGTPAPWAAALLMFLTLRLRFIRNEERALAASLGEPYQRYRASVRRWL